ncbi:hypothetical protein C6502_15790 [Candidatus Poribacteria bacterium]|nr:MAG: hypothetical protein C6502_15790 [Candidatus Poribacteria bacterium]
MNLRFEWDANKANDNITKHGVSFEEAVTVFQDVTAVIFDDENHSDKELREIIVGYSDRNRLLLVCFTERNDAIRIINARKATRREHQDYEKHYSY